MGEMPLKARLGLRLFTAGIPWPSSAPAADTRGVVWARLGLALAAIGVLYAPLLPGLAAEWLQFPSLSHGFVVPFIAAYLLWVRHQNLATVTFEPAISALPVLLAGLAIYTAGRLGGETLIARVSLPVMLFGAAALVAGWTVARQMAPAIGYLIFMVPLPYLPLRSITDASKVFDATVVATALSWLGIPVNQAGVLLHLPHITLEVADACSSIPATLSLLALGAAYGFVGDRRRVVRLTLLLVAVPLGLGSNIVRIFVTALAVHWFGRIALDNVIHTSHGTIVFLMTLGALIAIDRACRRLWPVR
jgi:exosortase